MREEENKNVSMMRYAGLATQWLVMLGLAVWAGLVLDKRIGLAALFVIILPVLALIISLWQLIRTLNSKQK